MMHLNKYYKIAIRIICISQLFLFNISAYAQVNQSTDATQNNLADAPWKMTATAESEQWRGFKVYTYHINNFTIQVAEPKTILKNKAWVMNIGGIGDGYHWQINERILSSGAYVLAINSYNTYGSDYGLTLMDSLYYLAIEKFGLSKKCSLFGISRAGLSIHRWAIKHSERVASIYCEGPVLDFKTWPMAWQPSAANWVELKKYYGFMSDADARAYKGNPIDNLNVIAKAKIPIRHIISLTEEHDVKIVPNEKNTLKAQQYLKKMGHTIDVVITPAGMKAPFSFDEASVQFMLSKDYD